jgi:predicted 3-demethylubiquinone-9 3-methyltransferase (glyoxalase superfamily)
MILKIGYTLVNLANLNYICIAKDNKITFNFKDGCGFTITYDTEEERDKKFNEIAGLIDEVQ